MKHLLIIGCLGIAALGTEAETLRVGHSIITGHML